MDITSSRFNAELVNILHDIGESHFVAFDLEFSGVAGRGPPRIGKPSLQEIYEETKNAADKYQVLQVGLTIVKEDLVNGKYVAKPYNFSISPLPTLKEKTFRRDWCMNSGAVQFLLKNRFNFGLPLLTGIPYLSRLEEVQARAALSDEGNTDVADMDVDKKEDEALIKHIRQSMDNWKEQSAETRENYLNIPNDDRGKGVPGVLNRYQMRLTHQVVKSEYPGSQTYGMQGFVQVTSPSAEELGQQRTLHKQRVDRDISRAIGFRWILEALAGRDVSGIPEESLLAALPTNKNSHHSSIQSLASGLKEKTIKRRKVLIGHNCFTDLINLHKFFLGELPAAVEDFQDNIHELFPAVVDTKYIASFGSGRGGDTSLRAVADDLDVRPEPKIDVPGDFDRYSSVGWDHEAGYDSFMTAKVAIKLSAKMEHEETYMEKTTSQPASSPPETNTAPFGVREDGYVTASEDLDSQVTEEADIKADGSVTPVTATRSSFDIETSDDTSGGSTAVSMTSEDTSQNTSSEPFSVVAVKEKKIKPVDWRSTNEVNKVRSAFAAANIYEVLGNDMDKKSSGGEQDLMTFSDPDSPLQKMKPGGAAEKGSNNVNELVKRGHLMPRWDGGNGFWQRFGNKLQVNSCKEGVCNLS